MASHSSKLLSVTDVESYEKWRAECMVEDKCPCAAIFLLADSELLFWREPGADERARGERSDIVVMPWLQRLRCELVSHHREVCAPFDPIAYGAAGWLRSFRILQRLTNNDARRVGRRGW